MTKRWSLFWLIGSKTLHLIPTTKLLTLYQFLTINSRPQSFIPSNTGDSYILGRLTVYKYWGKSDSMPIVVNYRCTVIIFRNGCRECPQMFGV